MYTSLFRYWCVVGLVATHFRYSGIIIPLLFGAWLAVLQMDQFGAAYFAIGALLVWWLASWLTSDYLVRLLPKEPRKPKQVNGYITSKRSFEIRRISVVALIIVACAGAAWWTRSIQVTKAIESVEEIERGIAAEMAMVSGDPDPLRSFVTVKNGSNTKLSAYQINCAVNGAVGAAGEQMNQVFLRTPKTESQGAVLDPGEPFSLDCLAPLRAKFLRPDKSYTHWTCMDVSAYFDYTIPNKSVSKEKEFRFVGRVQGARFFWVPQRTNDPSPPNSTCGNSFGPTGKEGR